MHTGILGGGISGLALAHFLDGKKTILEAQKLGGLASSFEVNGVVHDIGPHILFSKNQQVLDFMVGLLGDNCNKLRRNSKVYYKGNYVKYPFENELSALPEEDKEYCLRTFLNNPYRDMNSTNMLAFFLKIFGEGITRCYLEPYNRKIWKFEPTMMDTQMVERIPQPPDEDIIRSAHGESTEGYLHQLHFHYPKQGGFQSIIDALANRLQNTDVHTNERVQRIQYKNTWRVFTENNEYSFDRLVSTIPVHELVRCLPDVPENVKQAVHALKYNSLCVVLINTSREEVWDYLSVNIPDENIITHRVANIGFFGQAYTPLGTQTLMAEVTYRAGDLVDQMDDSTLADRVVCDLDSIGILNKQEVNFTHVRRIKYAYVIYDLEHRQNADTMMNYFRSINLHPLGRFARFEYMNSDRCVSEAWELADELNK